jgi:hypothetical protein
VYLYDKEKIRLTSNDFIVASGSTGNGADERGPDGVMSAVGLSK